MPMQKVVIVLPPVKVLTQKEIVMLKGFILTQKDTVMLKGNVLTQKVVRFMP